MAFPQEHRSLATTTMLAAADVGSLIGAPLVGKALDTFKEMNWPPYPTLLSLISAALLLSTVVYLVDQETH